MSASVDEATIRTQRRAADPEHSAWVSANAGAGKTRVLTERVARLLLSGVEPGRILCLTFTKAAAAEMLHRLFGMLAEWAVLPPGKLDDALTRLSGERPGPEQVRQARILFARTLDSPGGLRIQTIHSFCQDLLARFPLEAGVTPGFEVQDERTAAELLRAARDEVFRSLMDSGGNLPGFREDLTRHFSESSLAGFLAEAIGKRGRLRETLTRAGGLEAHLTFVRERLGTEKDATPERLIEAALDDNAFALYDLRRAAGILARGSWTERRAADAMHGFLSARDRAPHFERYRDAFFTKAGKPRRGLPIKPTIDAHPDVAFTIDAEQKRLAVLDDACRSARLAQMTETALRFAHAFFNAYESLKHERGILDYEDLILEARALLSYSPNAAWVLFKLDQSIDHVLVDEAQDTGPEQWDIVTKLTEDFFAGHGAEGSRVRTVFAVGDEKQSIYGFQGAAPELFRETAREIEARARAAHLSWFSETLDLSFRSLPAILEAVDLVFARPEAAAGLTFDGNPVAHRAWRGEGRGLVEVWPVVKPAKAEERPAWKAPLDRPPANDPKTILAARIADTIEEWFASGEAIHDGNAAGQLRPMRPGDILILVRRRDRLVDEMIRAFRERNIPVAGTDRLSLTDHIAVMDLVAAAQVTLLPEDDLTLAALLKSPLCGLDDQDLFTLAHGRSGSLAEALSSAGGRTEFAEARGRVDWLITHRDLRPFEFFSRLLTEESGRARLLARLGPDAADPIEEFLNQALAFERSHAPTLQGFLRWLERAAVEVKREMDQTADEIRIMTVHGAKGLQSSVVLLPDTCTTPNANHDPSLLPLAVEEDQAPAFVMAPAKADDCPASAEARTAAARKRDAEFRRLLYVALTRARDRLYVCGYETANRPRSAGCWYDLVHDALAARATEAPGAQGGKVLRFGEAPPRLTPRDTQRPSGPVTFPHWAERPPETCETSPRRLSPSGMAVREPVPAGPGREGTGAGSAARRGDLIHRLLELLPALDERDRQMAAERFLESRAADLPPSGRKELARESLQLLDDPAFAAVFGPGSLAEVPIAGILPETGPDIVIDGRIDRLLVTKTRILAVDFKTGVRPAPGAAVPEDYLVQMAAYRALLRRIYPERDVECALLWTRGPEFMRLSAEQMDAALQRAAGVPAP